MSYVVVRNLSKRGSIAMKTEHGPELVALKKKS